MTAKMIETLYRLQQNPAPLLPLKNPTTDATNNVALEQIKSSVPPTTTPVIAAESPKDLAIERLTNGLIEGLIEEGQFEKALSLLSTLIESNKGDKSLLVLSAECYIGLAFSLLEDPDMQAECVKRAKAFLDAALAITKKEDSSNPTIAEELKCINLLYEEILPFYENNQEYSQDLANEQFSTPFPDQIIYYKLIEQAKAHLTKTDNVEGVRENIYEEAELLTEEESPLVFLSEAEKYVSIAKTLEKGSEERTQNVKLALESALKAYKQESALLQAFPVLDIFQRFKNVFFELNRLLPENQYIIELYEHFLKLCEFYENEPRKIELQKNAKEKTYQVTKGPIGDFWKPFRLVAAFAFAFIFIVRIIDLGRRSITKLN